MPRVPVHTVHSAPDGSRDDLKALESQFGKVLNIFGEMAHAPTLIGLFTAADGAIAERTSLDHRTREAIHLTVAQVNDCRYCQSAYTAAAKAAGFSDHEALAIRRGHIDFDRGLAALLPVARELAANKGYVDDATWQHAIDVGWTDEQLLEAFADVVRTLLTNYFNHFVGTEIDVPRAPALNGAVA